MRKKNFLGLLLTIMLILSSFTPVSFADSSKEQLSIDFTTDKKEYKQGEDINIEINIKNTSGKDLKDIEIKNTLPKGIELKSSEGGEKIDKSNVKWTLQSLKNNESVKLKLSSNFPKYQSVVPVPDTGMDYFNYLLIGSILLLISTIGVIYIKKNPGKFDKKKATSTGMALIMTLGVLGQSLVIADASSNNNLSISKTLKLKCDGKELDNILEVKGTFVDDVEVDKPVTPEKPEENEKPNSYININAKRVNNVVILDWDSINEAKYTVKKGETKESLSIIEENLSENIYIDETEYTNKSYYYMVESKSKNGEAKESDIIEVKPFIDTDEDLLEDSREIELGTDSNNQDTDGDGLLDGEEVDLYETDPKNPDTDGDRLNDSFEVLESRTSPNKKDTDDNGIRDDKEDFDKDTLNNKKEMELGTDPLSDDTDYDNLKDYEELELGADPKNKDTDSDTLLDGDEVDVNLNPLKKDTDDDSILDPDELVEYKIENSDIDADEDVQVNMSVSTSGKNMEDIYINNTKGINFLTNEETPGYLGAPYYLNIPEGDEAVVEFMYNGDKDYSGELGIYFYNKDTQYLEEVTNGATSRRINVISAKVNKPGEYILLDKAEQRRAWEREIVPPNEENKKLDVILAIDSSGSMEWNDPDGLRMVESKIFIDRLIKQELGKVGIVDFDSVAKLRQELTTDIELLNNAINRIDSSGGTNISAALNISTNELKTNSSDNKYTLLLTDGRQDGSLFNYNSIEYAKENNNKVYTIGLGNDIDEELLKKIANETGGRYLYTDVAEGLDKLFEEFTGETIDKSIDTDKDGVSDYHEEYFRIGNGRIVQLNKNSAHTDEDGIADGEEAGLKKVGDKYENDGNYGFNKEKGYWIVKSDPSKVDTDGDYINDNEDGSVITFNMPTDTGFDMKDKIFMDASDATYIHTSTYKGEGLRGKTLRYVKDKYIVNGDEEKLRYGFESILDWDILYSDDSDVWLTSDAHDTGFGALAIKKGNNIIIAFEGSTFKIQALWGDWALTDGLVVGAGYDSKQVYSAYKFINRVMNNKDSLGCKIYITGHSLGGWLAQKVGGSILQGEKNLATVTETYYQQNQVPWTKKHEVQEMYNKTFSKRKNNISKIVTYAAPGFYNHTKIYNNSSQVKGKVFNYKMKHDPVSTVGEYELELGNTRWCKLGDSADFEQHPLSFYYENYSSLF